MTAGKIWRKRKTFEFYSATRESHLKGARHIGENNKSTSLKRNFTRWKKTVRKKRYKLQN